MRRPEEWVRWGGLFLSIQLYFWVGWGAGLVAFLLAIFGSIVLVQRRLSPEAPSLLSWKLLEESAPKSVQRELRQGKFDEKVGVECRTILEEAARSANVVWAVVREATPDEILKFRPLTDAVEGLMKSALARIQFATMEGRTPDEETVSELTKIEANLRVVLAEAKRLAAPSMVAN